MVRGRCLAEISPLDCSLGAHSVRICINQPGWRIRCLSTHEALAASFQARNAIRKTCASCLRSAVSRRFISSRRFICSRSRGLSHNMTHCDSMHEMEWNESQKMSEIYWENENYLAIILIHFFEFCFIPFHVWYSIVSLSLQVANEKRLEFFNTKNIFFSVDHRHIR